MSVVATLTSYIALAGVALAADAPQTQPAFTEAPTPEIVQRVMRPWAGDFDAMMQRRLVRVLVAYGRTSYFIDRGQQRGITYEAFAEFEKDINSRQSKQVLKTEVVFVPVRRDQLLPYLIAGKGDIAAANLTVTNRRQDDVSFADPVLTGVNEVVVTGPAAPGLRVLDDLAGKEIVVRRSSSYFESLQKLNASLKARGKAEVIVTPANENLEDEDILEMVNAGLLPMTAVDNHVARLWSKAFDKIKVHEELAVRTGGQIAWAIRKSSTQFEQALNEFVRGHKKGTEFGNIVYNRYLRDGKPVLNSASPQELRRFWEMEQVFQKYAKQYDFDWLMIAAQAYQESRLDQSLRSPCGAVGVMQVLPQTAAAPPIGIANVEQLENNVHAGTAYLRHVRDKYFNDPTIDAFNQQLFAFAAYNAGPARVAELRKKAQAMGLNPNKWFQNVEVVAAREIGRETVDYLAHILKYYVAYDRFVAQASRRAEVLSQ